MDIQPSAIYLFVVKNPRVTTATICDHFRADFSKVMPQLDQMKNAGVLKRDYSYGVSVWSAKR